MTAPAPEAYRPIDAEGRLRLEAPSGRTLEVVAEGNALRLDVPTWSELSALVPRARGTRSRLLRVVGELLSSHGLTLRLESGGRTFFELGATVRPNWLARLFRLAPARLQLSAITLFLRR
ncbi:MAG: hypothetical protein V2I25_03315 [Woeseiaceae bacterium]|nr:hypothetical protein [Woeseiaceae bacterium]